MQFSECRWEVVWGRPDRESSREKNRKPSQEHLGLLHQPFWRSLVNDGMRFVSFRQEVVYQSVILPEKQPTAGSSVQFSSVAESCPTL